MHVLFQSIVEEAPEARNDVQSLSGFAFLYALTGRKFSAANDSDPRNTKAKRNWMLAELELRSIPVFHGAKRGHF
jgi:hypothetical protein